jgi:hypothetical protein
MSAAAAAAAAPAAVPKIRGRKPQPVEAKLKRYKPDEECGPAFDPLRQPNGRYRHDWWACGRDTWTVLWGKMDGLEQYFLLEYLAAEQWILDKSNPELATIRPWTRPLTDAELAEVLHCSQTIVSRIKWDAYKRGLIDVRIEKQTWRYRLTPDNWAAAPQPTSHSEWADDKTIETKKERNMEFTRVNSAVHKFLKPLERVAEIVTEYDEASEGRVSLHFVPEQDAIRVQCSLLEPAVENGDVEFRRVNSTFPNSEPNSKKTIEGANGRRKPPAVEESPPNGNAPGRTRPTAAPTDTAPARASVAFEKLPGGADFLTACHEGGLALTNVELRSPGHRKHKDDGALYDEWSDLATEDRAAATQGIRARIASEQYPDYAPRALKYVKGQIWTEAVRMAKKAAAKKHMTVSERLKLARAEGRI